jgi:hypothetical protein
MCKHSLKAGCVYCHGTELAFLNAVTKTQARTRERRTQKYAARVAQAMRQEGSMWKKQAFRPIYDPLTRSLARHKMGYAGN